MKIEQVEAVAISIPLKAPVSDAVRTHTHRDHLIVKIRAGGLEGVGFALAYDGSKAMVELVNAIYRPMLLGASMFDTEHLWTEMFRQSIQSGRRGAGLRTISAIDIALWDLRGKAAKMPIMQLLGIHSQKLRCYVTGGYYRPGDSVERLIGEMGSYIEKGFSAVKLKVGALPARQDAARLKAIRQALGDDVEILLDANGGWPDSNTAIAALRRLEESRPYWIEEPVRPDSISAMARIAEAIDWPVATGELEATRWGFAELLERKAADILQPDAAVVGGVTEWLKVAHMAAAFDVPIAPHYHWDLHTQLVATIPNGIFVEYFVRESGVKVFDDIIANPLQPKDGFVAPRTAPGFGIEYNENAIKGYMIARSI
jgi:D-arabinonate dehydratase